jgi:hypothetical protein
MKHQSIACLTNALLALAGFALCSTAFAQEIISPYHPGDVIHILVKFFGPDAGKINSAAASLEISAQKIPKDQPNFATSLYVSDWRPSGEPNTFDVSVKIPTDQASGEYRIGFVRGIINEPSVVLPYQAPADFKERTYTIDNPRRIVRPSVEVK